ncbi:hypothetical protein BDN72DRAFT_959214 [Pluteus cervinus]|uniref:Uncharacterized protein n=1 Tax=Pluteus cervinus TaxID=181527 RepID=A0ACD3AX36_9AGAR|nr:hypothetical protein BDN72DRAFT_959214 [Pluteus cervinus]
MNLCNSLPSCPLVTMSSCSPSSEPTDASYPLGPPKTSFERVIHSLDQEKFEVDRYAYIDAVLTFSLFCPKPTRKKLSRPGDSDSGCCRVLVLENALSSLGSSGAGASASNLKPEYGSGGLGTIITNEEGVLLCQMCKASIQKDEPTRESCWKAAEEVRKQFPHLFNEETDVGIMTHLLLRYFLLFSTESPVSFRKVEKISETDSDGVDTGSTFGPGLKAIKQIPASTYVLTANGSMSSNEIDRPFVIRIRACQPDVNTSTSSEKRIVLGPIGFTIINHDCQPNCEIVRIPNSQALTLRTLKDIQQGETLTISREAGGYFESPPKASSAGPGVSESCRCTSCRPDLHPPKIRTQVQLAHNSTSVNPQVSTGTTSAGTGADGGRGIDSDANVNANTTSNKRKRKPHRAGRAVKLRKLAIERSAARVLEEAQLRAGVKLDSESELDGLEVKLKDSDLEGEGGDKDNDDGHRAKRRRLLVALEVSEGQRGQGKDRYQGKGGLGVGAEMKSEENGDGVKNQEEGEGEDNLSWCID